jgi:type IV pilus assembly protein PilA
MRTRMLDPGRGEHPSEAGFTLIELLVVIIIIGILAAIAIPVYLRQRERAYDSAAKSDVRNLAQWEENYLVTSGRYGSVSDIQADGQPIVASRGVTLTITYDGGTGYCLTAKQALSPTTWYYDSLAGGIQPKLTAACPVATGGLYISGGSITG